MSAISAVSPALHLLVNELTKIPQNEKCGALALALLNRQTDLAEQIQACLPQINTKFTSAKVTPLHLAAMSGNLDAMTQLKAAGADLDPNDKNRFTPLHHAAMAGNKQATEHLLSLGANPKRLTNMGGSYADYLRFTLPKEDLSPHQAHFSAHKKDVYRVESHCLPNGVQIAGEVVATPKTLASFWHADSHPVLTPKPGLDSIRPLVMENYAAFKENPPKLSVKPLTALEGEKNCGLFADQEIKAGQIVAEYTGELLSPLGARQANPEYLWLDYPPIDGFKHRSVAAMANDAFPNVRLFHLTTSSDNSVAGLDGIAARKVFVALDDIKAGEQIAINYGTSHSVKSTGAHVELKWEELKNYFSNRGWDASIVMRDPNSLNREQNIDRESFIQKFQYVLQTPSTLKRMAKEGVITKQDIEALKKSQPQIANAPSVLQAERELSRKKEREGNLPLATAGGVLAGLAAAYIGARLVYPRA